MDKLIDIQSFSLIKNQNKDKIKQFLTQIKQYKDVPIVSISDDILVKILDSIFIKNEIFPPHLCSKGSYVTSSQTYNKFASIFISPRNIVSCIDIILGGCEIYLNSIDKSMLNNLQNKISSTQNTIRNNNKFLFIETYSHFLHLKECVNTLFFELYNDYNHIYLETLYFKYNMLQFENLEQLLVNIKKLQQDYLKLKIPFSFEINKAKITFNNSSIDEILTIIDKNIENYSLKIIHSK